MLTKSPFRIFSPAYRSARNLTKFANEKDRFSDNPIQVTFLRHGQSTWNKENIFIGMTDTPLTEEGIVEAVSAGKMLASLNAEFDCVYTSLLKRSTSTVANVLREIDQEWIPVVKDWRLNERNYGALVGQNKKQCVAQHGKEQVRRWRRSWDEPPPPMSRDSKYWPYRDRRYKLLGVNEHEIPLSESLRDVTKRTAAFWDEVIVPQLRDRKRVLIVGHENNLRSIIKRLDNISNEAIINIELPRAIPLVYHLHPLTLRPIKVPDAAEGLSGRYLCTKLELQAIAERDFRQVYELNCPSGLARPSVPAPVQAGPGITATVPISLGVATPGSGVRQSAPTAATGGAVHAGFQVREAKAAQTAQTAQVAQVARQASCAH